MPYRAAPHSAVPRRPAIRPAGPCHTPSRHALPRRAEPRQMPGSRAAPHHAAPHHSVPCHVTSQLHRRRTNMRHRAMQRHVARSVAERGCTARLYPARCRVAQRNIPQSRAIRGRTAPRRTCAVRRRVAWGAARAPSAARRRYRRICALRLPRGLTETKPSTLMSAVGTSTPPASRGERSTAAVGQTVEHRAPVALRTLHRRAGRISLQSEAINHKTL